MTAGGWEGPPPAASGWKCPDPEAAPEAAGAPEPEAAWLTENRSKPRILEGNMVTGESGQRRSRVVWHLATHHRSVNIIVLLIPVNND